MFTPWGACGWRDPDNKLVRDFYSPRQGGIMPLTCGTFDRGNVDAGYGYRHIQYKHVETYNEWPFWAALSVTSGGTSEQWRQFFDWSVALTLEDPDRVTVRLGGNQNYCYERAVYRLITFEGVEVVEVVGASVSG